MLPRIAVSQHFTAELFTAYAYVCVWSDPEHNFWGIHPDELSALESVREITDNLQIQGDFSGFRNLSFFRNLEVIHGRVLDRSVIYTQEIHSNDFICGSQAPF